MLSKTPKRCAGVAAAAGLSLVAAPLFATPAFADDEGPQNIILLISDGAGYNQFDIASLYEHGNTNYQVTVDPESGAIEHSPGQTSYGYEDYPVSLAMSHYSASGRAEYVPEDAWGDFGWVAEGATDSAASATAFGTGVKTNNGWLGYDPDEERLLTIGEQAKAAGKSAGLVTDVPFNHATPAGFIAHNTDRNDYQGLATEMIDSDLDVIMGAGHPNFTDNNTSRASNYTWISADDFDRLTAGDTPYDYIESRSAFENLAEGGDVPERVFGMPQVAETLQYNRSGLDNNDVLPGTDAQNHVASLSTMAQGALNVLERNDEGFFLMIEAGAVDWAGHANQTTRVIEEQMAFNSAIETVDEWVETNSSWDETLVIITADHETGYLAGEGAGPETGWTPMTGEAGELPNVTWHSGGHTNALVPIFAKGAGSDTLASYATSWDSVRGAYLDNTDVGNVIFDYIGHAPSTDENTVAVEASVAQTVQSGTLSLSVAAGGPVALEAGADELGGNLPQVTVQDTRSEVEAQGDGWAVSGAASEFRAGNRTIGAENFSWLPSIVSSDGGAAAGAQATLEEPAALAESDRSTRVGTTVVDADLELNVPDEAASGNYGSEITLTLFAKD